MDSRERFLSALKFGKPDRIPLPSLFYSFHHETVRRWQREGVRRDVHIVSNLGLERCDLVPVNIGPIPHYEQAELEEIEEWRLGIDREIHAKVEEGIEEVEERFPIRGPEGVEVFKKILSPESPARYPRFWEDYVRRVRGRSYPLGLYLGGPLSWLVEWIGPSGLAKELERGSSWVQDLADYVVAFLAATLGRAVREIDLDFALFSEPRVYKLVMISDRGAVEGLLRRIYGPMIGWLKDNGIDLIILSSPGYLGDMIHLWVELGINVLSVQVEGGYDVASLRKLFGTRLSFIGNVDHRVLAWSKRDIAEEVGRKLSVFKEGGYIPAPDHTIMPDVPWENFEYFMDLMKKGA
jgi:uroporphyrinogen decarboxylase